MMRWRRGRFLAGLLFLAGCALLTAFLYGSSLDLPAFFDDFVHYPYVAANGIRDIWLTLDELAYYRPLTFSLWRMTYAAGQGHMLAADRAINLILHALNGALVGLLALRLWSKGSSSPPIAEGAPDWWRAGLSATLFILFPFSYQAVPWIGSLSHILVTTLVLLSLTCYLQMRRSGSKVWGAASLVLALLAPFAHENGVLVMPLLVAIELTTPNAVGRWRRAVQAGVSWSLP